MGTDKAHSLVKPIRGLQGNSLLPARLPMGFAGTRSMTQLAFLFPGQGSQQPGMGRDFGENFAVARETLAEADEALGFALSRLCFEGPTEELQLTANTQPAVLACSIEIGRASC